jgi:hypothetical protein
MPGKLRKLFYTFTKAMGRVRTIGVQNLQQ